MINVSESASDWQAQCASDWKQIQHLHVRLNLQSVTGRISVYTQVAFTHLLAAYVSSLSPNVHVFAFCFFFCMGSAFYPNIHSACLSLSICFTALFSECEKSVLL